MGKNTYYMKVSVLLQVPNIYISCDSNEQMHKVIKDNKLTPIANILPEDHVIKTLGDGSVLTLPLVPKSNIKNKNLFSSPNVDFNN